MHDASRVRLTGIAYPRPAWSLSHTHPVHLGMICIARTQVSGHATTETGRTQRFVARDFDFPRQELHLHLSQHVEESAHMSIAWYMGEYGNHKEQLGSNVLLDTACRFTMELPATYPYMYSNLHENPPPK
jgi:hypothetical protein